MPRSQHLPRSTLLTKIKETFFSNKKRLAFTVFTLSTVGLLIPTIIELVRSATKNQNAFNRLKTIKEFYDATFSELTSILNEIGIDKQKIIDLDCAMAGYKNFNEVVTAYYENIQNSTLPPAERLEHFWNLHFVPNRTETEETSQTKEYLTQIYTQAYRCNYNCGSDSEGKQIACCYTWDWDWVPENYIETTTIFKSFNNMLEGGGTTIASLDCGSFSRTVGTTGGPQRYLAHESNHETSGSQESRHVWINYDQEWGSETTARFRVDDFLHVNAIRPPLAGDQVLAAANLIGSLSAFISGAIAMFNATGGNYQALQEGFFEAIPRLINKSLEVNATLQLAAAGVTTEQAAYTQIHEEDETNKKIWLSILFLVPLGLTALALGVRAIGKAICNTAWSSSTPNGVIYPQPAGPEAITSHHVDLEAGNKVEKKRPPVSLFSIGTGRVSALDDYNYDEDARSQRSQTLRG